MLFSENRRHLLLGMWEWEWEGKVRGSGEWARSERGAGGAQLVN
jgi:hypothetical protein